MMDSKMAERQSKKIFILDTNVILHDPTCLHQFQENDVVIPLTAIEEIDHFKRGSQVINLNAREFARTFLNIKLSKFFTLSSWILKYNLLPCCQQEHLLFQRRVLGTVVAKWKWMPGFPVIIGQRAGVR
jgi:hypothetical protein